MPARDERNLWRYFGLGLELAVAALALGLVGWWVDREFGTAPWGVLIGAALGFAAGMYRFIQQALAALREVQPPASRDARSTPKPPTDRDDR